MSGWLRSIANAILGKVPGKTGRVDTATRMGLDAAFLDDGLVTRTGGRRRLSPEGNRTFEEIERALKVERESKQQPFGSRQRLRSDPTPKVDQLEELKRLISPD